MAISRGFRKFAKRMDVLSAKFARAADVGLRKAALVADQVMVLATPVDTGRARANYIVSVQSREDSPGLDPIETGARGSDSRGAANAQISLDQAANVLGISIFDQSKSRDTKGRFVAKAPTIFVTNTLPYIEQLDNGSSDQAPNGMLRQGVEAAIEQIKRDRFLG